MVFWDTFDSAPRERAEKEIKRLTTELAAVTKHRDELRKEADMMHDEHKTARAELAGEREWRPMATAPTDGTLILAAVRIYAAGTKRFLYWDIQAVLLDEGLALTSCGDDCGWRWEDFEVWKPIALDGIDAVLKGGK